MDSTVFGQHDHAKTRCFVLCHGTLGKENQSECEHDQVPETFTLQKSSGWPHFKSLLGLCGVAEDQAETAGADLVSFGPDVQLS
jgi:hypothetical protein